jgi:hypothetical protein
VIHVIPRQGRLVVVFKRGLREFFNDPTRNRPMRRRPAESSYGLAANAAVGAEREHRHVVAPCHDGFIGGPGLGSAEAKLGRNDHSGRGFSKKLIEKVCFRNWLRVLKKTWS